MRTARGLLTLFVTLTSTAALAGLTIISDSSDAVIRPLAEPDTLWLLGLGVVAWLIVRFRKK